MALTEPSFTIGIEEEYLLVDKVTRDVASDPPEALFKACQSQIKGLVAHEFLKAQIEVNTEVCATITDARINLKQIRTIVTEVADEYGLAPIAPRPTRFPAGRNKARPRENAIRSSPRTCKRLSGG